MKSKNQVFIFLRLNALGNIIPSAFNYKFKNPIVDIKSINKNSIDITVALIKLYLLCSSFLKYFIASNKQFIENNKKTKGKNIAYLSGARNANTTITIMAIANTTCKISLIKRKPCLLLPVIFLT